MQEYNYKFSVNVSLLVRISTGNLIILSFLFLFLWYSSCFAPIHWFIFFSVLFLCVTTFFNNDISSLFLLSWSCLPFYFFLCAFQILTHQSNGPDYDIRCRHITGFWCVLKKNTKGFSCSKNELGMQGCFKIRKGERKHHAFVLRNGAKYFRIHSYAYTPHW